MKTGKITPTGKFTANVRISVIYYIFVTYRHRLILTENCCAWWLIFYCPWVQWVALREQICAVSSQACSLFTLRLAAGANISFILLCLKTSFFSSSFLCNQSGWRTRGTGLETYKEKQLENVIEWYKKVHNKCVLRREEISNFPMMEHSELWCSTTNQV